jgi:hypothetical protein
LRTCTFTEILNLYHVLAHLTVISKSVFGEMDSRSRKLDAHSEQVKKGETEALLWSLMDRDLNG